VIDGFKRPFVIAKMKHDFRIADLHIEHQLKVCL